ncbi:hypothetical protein H845_1479 [Komagataeibacter xylinus E25]|nr:hypothetical protein H845_1479 [Komagataeibacter xylinus E25]
MIVFSIILNHHQFSEALIYFDNVFFDAFGSKNVMRT